MEGCERRLSGHLRSGLTLIELLVAIAVLGVMGALLMPRLAPEKSETPVAVVEEAGYIGIGAVLRKPSRRVEYAWIDHLFPGAPAAEAGLRSGDLIVRVDGIDTLYESVDSVGNRVMGGPIGSPVELTVLREGESVDLTIVRQWIHPPHPFGRRARASTVYLRSGFGW
jgi:carboxyl-terminal processing protease